MGGAQWDGMERGDKKRKGKHKIKYTKTDNLLRVLKRIEKLTRPEGDEVGYANSDSLEIVMEVYGLTVLTLQNERTKKWENGK